MDAQREIRLIGMIPHRDKLNNTDAIMGWSLLTTQKSYLGMLLTAKVVARQGEPEKDADSLEEVAREEQEFLREKLREQLKREPTDEELNEYERQHTEGY